MSNTEVPLVVVDEDNNKLDLIRGENNALEYSIESVGDSRVALFFSLVRGCTKSKVDYLMDNCLSTSSKFKDCEESAMMIADLFIITFQTRDCRNGKGEKDLFYYMLLYLYRLYPDTVLKLLGLFKEYGYFKDFYKILELEEVQNNPEYHLLCNKIIDYIANQLILDENHFNANRMNEISICAKYAPREGKHYAIGKNKIIYEQLVEKIYPSNNQNYKQNRKQYRQLISKLTSSLDIPEVKMCSKRFHELDFSKVPSVCTNKFLKAFLNEKITKKDKLANEDCIETGDRFPDDEDRIQCRSNLMNVAKNNKVKGSQLHPHEIIKTIYTNKKNVSLHQKEILDGQWNDMKQNLLNKLNQSKSSTSSENSINIGKLIPLSDVSGSMSGLPMLVSIALGILISELNHPAFRNQILTFESQPHWMDLSNFNKIADKVNILKNAPWGGSTNIKKAFELMIHVIKLHKLPMNEVPDLIIFSDMQFDQCTDDFNTQYNVIKEMFHDVGIEISGSPYLPPKIIFWNLRANTVGFPVQSSEENVLMLSGFSPSLLKFVLENDNIIIESEDKDNNNKVTPYQTLRKVLDDERYYPIRVILNDSLERDLFHYYFQIPTNSI